MASQPCNNPAAHPLRTPARLFTLGICLCGVTVTASQPSVAQMTTHGVPAYPSTGQTAMVPAQGYPYAGPMQMPHPAGQQAPLEVAKQLEREGNLAGAAAQYHAILTQFPRDRAALIGYARMRHRAGDLQGSVHLYQQALQAYPNDPVILNDLGLCLARMGDLPNAVATLRASIGLRPDSQRYRNNLAIVLLEMDRSEEAQALLAEIHGDLIAKYNIGLMLSRRGKTEQAKRLLAEVVQANPTFEPASTLLAQLASPIGEVAALPTGMGAATSASATLEATSGAIQRQSAQIAPGTSQAASAAVYLEAMGMPPEVESYPIPGVGLKP